MTYVSLALMGLYRVDGCMRRCKVIEEGNGDEQ